MSFPNTLSRFLCGALAAFLLPAISASAHEEHRDQPPWQEASAWPDRIITTLPGDPTTGFAVSWRTSIDVSVALAETVPASEVARFDLDAVTVKGETTQLDLTRLITESGEAIDEIHNTGLPTVNYHSVEFNGLEPDTLYAWRVRGEAGHWSAWRQFRTAPLDGPVSFIFFGDAQTGIRSHVTRLFDTARQFAPNARFAIHGGDLVNTPFYDREWAEWFEAVGPTHYGMPAIPVAGNHDYVNLSKDGEEGDDKLFIADKTVSPIWRPQFALPVVDSLPSDLAETVYDVRYSQDIHVFVLDSSGVAFQEQLDWLERSVRASDACWKILTMHHPLFSFVGGREHPAHKERREQIAETLEALDLDLVITGHRHSSQLGEIGEDVARYNVGDMQSVDTVFIITASSTKRGESKVGGWEAFSNEEGGDYALTRYGDNVPLFGVFDVAGTQLTYRAVDAVGEVYDGFTLTKQRDGSKQLVNSPEASEEPKTYDNTARYIPWDDLR